MKELLSLSSNKSLVPLEGGQFTPRVELILLVSEPSYGYGLEGISKSRQVSDFRFMSSTKGLREMAKALVDMADEADEMADRVNAAIPEETT